MSIQLYGNEAEKFCKEWDEVRLCFSLIKQRKAKTVDVRGKDGKTCRCTRPVWRQHG